MAPSPSPIVLLHGFTQTSVSWRPIVEHLRVIDADLEVVALDLPGHGDASHVQADLATSATWVADRIGEQLDHEPAVVVGYSMGGRVALRLALDHPAVTRSVVLFSATAGIDDPIERHARRAADGALADQIEVGGVDVFLESWLALPLFEGRVPAPDDLQARRANPAAGLASSLRLAGTGTMDPPWWSDIAAIDVPILVAWGERDAKFAALGHRLAGAIGANATMQPLRRAGHAAHLDDPAAAARLIAHWATSPGAPPTLR